MYLYKCAYVHLYTVYKHSSVLEQLLLYAANINLFRKFMLFYLLLVLFGCLFVMLTSVLIVDITVDLENFHTIYTHFRCSAMCFLLYASLILLSFGEYASVYLQNCAWVILKYE